MDAPSGPAGEFPQDLLSALPPDLLRRILQAVEGDAPQDLREEKSPLAALLLVCKALSVGARGSITRLHFDMTQLQHQLLYLSLHVHSNSTATSIERQLEVVAEHFPNLNKFALGSSSLYPGRRPSVAALRALPHLSHLALDFTPSTGLGALPMVEELMVLNLRDVYLTELPPALRVLRLGVAARGVKGATLMLRPSPSGFPPLLRTAEIRDLILSSEDWEAPDFPLSSLTALALTKIDQLPPLSVMANLETLSVSNCPSLYQGFIPFKGLDRLQVLRLGLLPECQGFPMGFSLPSLRHLSISQASFNRMIFRGEFPMMEELVVDQVSVVAGLLGYNGLPCLKRLRITKSFIRFVSLNGEMPMLEAVYLERLPALAALSLRSAPSLRKLFMSHVSLNALPFFDVTTYPVLEDLHLEGLVIRPVMRVLDTESIKAVQVPPSLRSLWLIDLPSEILPSLSGCTRLEELHLEGFRALDRKSITALQVPPSLESLALIDLPSEILPSLSGCTRLEDLYLYGLKPWCGPADAETCPFDDSDLPDSLQRVLVSDVRVFKQEVGQEGHNRAEPGGTEGETSQSD